MRFKWDKYLWGDQARFSFLLVASILLLFSMLGSKGLWTQEHRWADIVSGMFYRNDFLHPFLDNNFYYDKPLLSYWLIAGLSFLSGHLNPLIIRLPSAFAGLISIWAIFELGREIKSKQLGLMAGWLLLTTFYFVFWARTSSADMLNVAGSLIAVLWYFKHKDEPRFYSYCVFFILLALTGLFKGLIGPIVAIIAVGIDMILSHTLLRHLRWKTFFSLIPALIIYLLPFWASEHFNNGLYKQNGLYEVYRENFIRYFQPFDHKDPFYIYFIYLPIYLLPWSIFFIPGILSLKKRWIHLSAHSRWLVWTVFYLFIFFTLSGSRRSYYILPVVPFALLMCADFILEGEKIALKASWLMTIAFLGLVVNFLLLQPIYYSTDHTKVFYSNVKSIAESQEPWNKWQFLLLDARSKDVFYLHIPPVTKNFSLPQQQQNSPAELMKEIPLLKNLPDNMILITRCYYQPILNIILKDKNYKVVKESPSWINRRLKISNDNLSLAFIPVKNPYNKRS